MRFPHFDFYPGDWLNDSHNAALTYEEWGVHIALLCRMWDQPDCTLPDDNRYLSRLLRVSENQWLTWREVLVDGPQPVLEVNNGRLISPKLLAVFTHACDASRKAKEKADKRWQSHPKDADRMPSSSSSNATAMLQQSQSNASHLSPVTYQENIKTNDDNARARDDIFSDQDVITLAAAWSTHMTGTLTKSHMDRLAMYRESTGPPLDLEVLTWAMSQCAVQEKRTLAYLDTILRNCQTRGHTTLALVQAHEAQRTQDLTQVKKGGRYDRHPRRYDPGRHDDQDSLDDLMQGG